MSGQSAPLSDEPLFLAPTLVDEPLFLAPTLVDATAADGAAAEHHPCPEPAEHLCTCGKIREACVHDEIRALFGPISH